MSLRTCVQDIVVPARLLKDPGNICDEFESTERHRETLEHKALLLCANFDIERIKAAFQAAGVPVKGDFAERFEAAVDVDDLVELLGDLPATLPRLPGWRR